VSGTVLVAGSANLDFVVRAHHVPAPGETVLGREFATFAGGKGANQAVACARAGGAATRMLVALGDDPYAAVLEGGLREAGVQLDVVRSERPTGTAFICLADDAENAITVAPGANEALQPAHLPPLDGVAVLLMQLETPLDSIVAYARAARAAGVRVMLNAAPARALPEALLRDVDVLVVNEGELQALAGAGGTLAAQLARLPVRTVVVTLGGNGCIAREAGVVRMQAAFPVVPLDTTGAGDTFCGTLAAALARGAMLGHGLREASAAAALACTRLGAQAGAPERAEVEALLLGDGDQSAAARQRLAAACGLADEDAMARDTPRGLA
jgi:ribokinase